MGWSLGGRVVGWEREGEGKVGRVVTHGQGKVYLGSF